MPNPFNYPYESPQLQAAYGGPGPQPQSIFQNLTRPPEVTPPTYPTTEPYAPTGFLAPDPNPTPTAPINAPVRPVEQMAEGYGGTMGGPSAPDLNALGRPSRDIGMRSVADFSRTPVGMMTQAAVPGGGILGGLARSGDISNFAKAYGYQDPTFGQQIGSFFGGDPRGEVSQTTAVGPNPYGATTASGVAEAAAAAGLGQGGQQAAIDRAFNAQDIGHPGMGSGVDFGGLDADIDAASDIGFGFG